MLAISPGRHVVVLVVLLPAIKNRRSQRPKCSFQRGRSATVQPVLQCQDQSNFEAWSPCRPRFGVITLLLHGHLATILSWFFWIGAAWRATNSVQDVDVPEHHCQCCWLPFCVTHWALVEVEPLDLVGLLKVLPFFGAPDRHELLITHLLGWPVTGRILRLFHSQCSLQLLRKTNVLTKNIEGQHPIQQNAVTNHQLQIRSRQGRQAVGMLLRPQNTRSTIILIPQG